MHNRFTLLLAAALGLAACSKSEPGAEPCPKDAVALRYAQTGCADPWAGANQNTDAAFQGAAVQYVQQRGIQLYRVQVDNNGQPTVCLACTCPTGRRLLVFVQPADVPALVQLGFRQ